MLAVRANVGIAAGDMAMATTTGARIGVAGLPLFAPPSLYVVAVQNNAGTSATRLTACSAPTFSAGTSSSWTTAPRA